MPKQEYTAEFKELGLVEQALRNWVKAADAGKIIGLAPSRDYPLPDMCEVLAASISGCRAWRRGGKPAPSLVLLLVVLVLSGGGGV